MPAQTILWVDLRTAPSAPDLCSSLPPAYTTRRLRDVRNLLQAVQSSRPWAVCFEYDVPDARGLAALHEVKTRHASLPIIMLTEKLGRKLQTLAFRHCVWDHLVKPMSVRRLCDCLRSIGKGAPPADFQTVTIDAAPSIATLPDNPNKALAVAPAISYVASNYSEKLQLSTAAKLCDLSRFQFSRTFKKAQGLTFRDFVIQTRIQRAAELMRRPTLSVTEAAFMAGFNDLSYFSRVFRRQLGVSPSQYRRRESEPTQMPLFPLEDLRNR
jgi:AraC-like DNA-binding protein